MVNRYRFWVRSLGFWGVCGATPVVTLFFLQALGAVPARMGVKSFFFPPGWVFIRERFGKRVRQVFSLTGSGSKSMPGLWQTGAWRTDSLKGWGAGVQAQACRARGQVSSTARQVPRSRNESLSMLVVSWCLAVDGGFCFFELAQ